MFRWLDLLVKKQCVGQTFLVLALVSGIFLSSAAGWVGLGSIQLRVIVQHMARLWLR